MLYIWCAVCVTYIIHCVLHALYYTLYTSHLCVLHVICMCYVCTMLYCMLCIFYTICYMLWSMLYMLYITCVPCNSSQTLASGVQSSGGGVCEGAGWALSSSQLHVPLLQLLHRVPGQPRAFVGAAYATSWAWSAHGCSEGLCAFLCLCYINVYNFSTHSPIKVYFNFITDFQVFKVFELIYPHRQWVTVSIAPYPCQPYWYQSFPF